MCAYALGVSSRKRTQSGKPGAGAIGCACFEGCAFHWGCALSAAAVVILPQVWATACAQSNESGRKGPHSLRLVQARAVPEVLLRRPVAPHLAFYRKYTEGMLRRYMKLSMEAGRVPSMLGREMFRGRVTSYKVRSFEDVVIFVHDVGKCVGKLDTGQQHLVRRIALQGHTQGDTAALLGVSLRTVVRRYAEALDELTREFLEKKMLEPLRECEGAS